MCKVNPNDGYTHVAHFPSRFDDYLVKTIQGTYEFAHFALGEWTILGDNKGAEVEFWTEIPQVEE